MIEGKFVTDKKLFIEYSVPAKDEGRTPLFFVGGAFDGSWVFKRHMEYLSAHNIPVYALNPRGFYKSRCGYVHKLDYPDYIADIREAVTALGLKKIILAGYSIGGILVQKYAESPALDVEIEAIVLIDPSYPSEFSPPDPGLHIKKCPGVMNFWPPKRIVEEMYDDIFSRWEYLQVLDLFKKTYISGKAYFKVEEEKISIDGGKIKAPLLLIGVNPEDPPAKAMIAKTGCAAVFFEGYSHGSILTSRYFVPVASRVVKWIAGGFREKNTEIYNWYMDLSEENIAYRTKLYYYSGWKNPVIDIYDNNRRNITRISMSISGKGRVEGENIFFAEFNFKKNNCFILRQEDKIDRPCYAEFYGPNAAELHLADGEFYFSRPEKLIPPAYHKRVYDCPGLAWKFKANIRLPRNYDEKKKYPVCILNDGQNQYKGHGSHGGWHTDAISDSLSCQGKALDVILVAVESPRHRNQTYLLPPIGHSDIYINFLADTVLKELKKEFSITDDRNLTGIIGASYGANNSVYAGLYRPEVFGLIGSLSFAYLAGSPLRNWMKKLDKLPFKKLYVDCGTKWAHDMPRKDDHIFVTRDLINIAGSKGMRGKEDLAGGVFEGHFHNEFYWRKRIGYCLAFLFSYR